MAKKVVKKVKREQVPNYKFPPRFNTLSTQYHHPFVVVIPDKLITINRFFSSQLCHDLIRSFESLDFETTTPLGRSKDYAARVNDRASTYDIHAAHTLYKHLATTISHQEEDLEWFRGCIGLNANLRMYRYLPHAHYFGAHYDDAVDDVEVITENAMAKGKTQWTMLVYLSGGSDLDGGDTVFYNDAGEETAKIHPQEGLVVLHRHGQDCLLHEALKVNNGIKWVLRSDLVYL